MKPLALDLCCGKGGWAKGLIAAGWDVRGAQKFMGTAKWHCGPFYLWGDVPALMPRFSWRHKESCSSTAVAERSMVPFELALHIGRVFHPGEERCA